jgi:molybdopterin-biosynthesis enzyme MoeA-like protein
MPPFRDITYASLAKSFGQELKYNDETIARMEEASRHRVWMSQQTEEQRTARKRMALFPEAGEVLFVASDVWVVRIPSFSYGIVH